MPPAFLLVFSLSSKQNTLNKDRKDEIYVIPGYSTIKGNRLCTAGGVLVFLRSTANLGTWFAGACFVCKGVFWLCFPLTILPLFWFCSSLPGGDMSTSLTPHTCPPSPLSQVWERGEGGRGQPWKRTLTWPCLPGERQGARSLLIHHRVWGCYKCLCPLR